MSATSIRSAWAITLLAAITAPSAWAQQPIQGLVLTPSGAPAAGAAVSLHADPPAAPDCLRRWLEPPPAIQTETDSRGNYRIPSPGRGWLVITHPSGVGALVADATPGVPDRVQLRPLAEIHLGPSPAARAFVTATGGDEPHYLGPREGPTVRLPAGRYSLLIERAGVWEEHSCDLFESRRIELPHEPGQRRVRTPATFDGNIVAASCPEVVMSSGGDLLLSNAATPRILRIGQDQGGQIVFSEIWLPTDGEDLVPRTGPLATRKLQVHTADPRMLERASVFTMLPTARGPTVRARAPVDSEGRSEWAVAGDETKVMVHSPGHAPRVLDHEQLGQITAVALDRGFDLTVAVGEAGEESSGLTVALEHSADPWLVYTTRTDRRGQAVFRDLPAGRAVLRLLSPDHLADEQPISIPHTDQRLVLTARRGEEVRGLVLLADDTPARGAAVLLRDTTDALQRLRRAVADAEGRFSFGGIAADTLFTLSAELQRAGQTWSAQLRGVQARQGEWRLVLLHEDPPPPHKRAR